nr:hypothetical protein [Tanacetum cinerariifolium]
PSPIYIPYVPEPVYPEYIPPEDDVFPVQEQPLPVAASPTAESPGYIPESDPDEDPKEDDDEDPEEDPADYPTDHDDDDEEEQPASTDSIPPPPAPQDIRYGIRDTWIDPRDVAEEEALTTLEGVNTKPLPAAASPTTDSPGYIPKSDPDEDLEDDDDEDPEEDPADYPADHDDEEEEDEASGDDADEEDEEQDEDDDDEEEEHSASADSIPPPPALRVTARISFRPSRRHCPSLRRMLRASPHILPIPIPTASPPLQLLSSNRRADRPEVTLPSRKRLSIVHCSGYEAGESSAAAAARPIEGRRADYGFVGSVEAEIRRRIAEDIGYGIRDTWIDPRDVAEEEALTTLEGVNTRVTQLAAVQEQDTQDIYGVMEDAQGRQTEMFQRVETLVDDSRYHYETGRLVDQEARCSREAWAHSIGLSSAGHLVTALSEIQALQAREQARAGHIDSDPDHTAFFVTGTSSDGSRRDPGALG